MPLAGNAQIGFCALDAAQNGAVALPRRNGQGSQPPFKDSGLLPDLAQKAMFPVSMRGCICPVVWM